MFEFAEYLRKINMKNHQNLKNLENTLKTLTFFKRASNSAILAANGGHVDGAAMMK